MIPTTRPTVAPRKTHRSPVREVETDRKARRIRPVANHQTSRLTVMAMTTCITNSAAS